MRKATLYIITICAIAIFPLFSLAQETQTLSLSCKNADIIDVLRGIAIQSGVNIVPDNSVTGTVTIHLDKAPFEAGLRTLLETNGFTYEKKDDIYLVGKKATATPNINISVADGKLTIDARKASVLDVIEKLSTEADINIVAEDALPGDITAHFSNIPIDDALYALFSANNYTLYENGGIYRVGNRALSKGSLAIFLNKGLLTIDVKDAPVEDVLQDIAKQSKINLVIVGGTGKTAMGNVTMRLENVSLERALEMLTAASGTTYKKIEGYKKVDDIYLVGKTTMQQGVENPLIEQKVIWLKHIDGFEFVSALPSDIPANSVKPLSDRNAIVVSGARQTIEKIENLIKELDIDNDDIRSRQLTAVSVEVDEDGLITIDAKDASISAVIREIAIKTGINVMILDVTSEVEGILRPRPISRTQTQRQTVRPQATPLPSPSTRSRRAPSRTSLANFDIGNINLRMEKATLDEVFDALFSGTGYTYALRQSGDKDFYIIGTGRLMVGQSNPLTVSKRIPLNYLNVATEDDRTSILDLLPLNIPEENITLLPDQNAIAVIGTPEMIEELEEYLAQIDVPAPQVMIEAILLELSLGSAEELGIEWSADKDRAILDVKSGVSFVFDSLATVPETFNANLKALLAENRARVLSNPRVAVINGQQAKIDVGVTYLFETNPYIYGGLPGIYTGGAEIYRGGTESYKSGTGSYREGEIPTSGSYYRSSSNFNRIHTGITLDITP
ncbi:MAG: secretin and TonB N-terminal domain-containing protein, partial [Candidatus Poribacteria bacterium]